ncbi:glutamate ABC transporter substrate-binding protein [Planosporangium thailandense]|uniref:Glutamate ABC transporter substrate-binding protein n=1 Tax=Planosporangium thailandense TaxID=765197 RepID=A0ABX0XQZ1_9ACTN|nr:glutamate ABC transporter substrate-binding protein [Planosporangium thailandense]NJC68302.1 glutamate ABC transporter substrate-binding protein [Planosporangium thailandense]
MRLTRFAALAASAALMLGAAACGGGGSSGGSGSDVKKDVKFDAGTTMEALNKAQKIKIGTKFDQPLFGLKGLDGKPAGFDVEIAKIIAGELGIPADKIEWVETPSKVREEYIEQAKVDMVVATYTINDARKQRIDFAGPYYVAGQQILTRKDDNSISGPDSFKDGTKKVCSVTGSTPAKTIEQYLKDKATQLVLFDTYAKCADAVKNKQVDALTTDNVILSGFVSQSPNDFKLVGSKFTQEPYGIGVKKGDTKFRAFINDVLEKIAKDGRYEKAWKDTVGKVDSNTPSAPAVDRY